MYEESTTPWWVKLVGGVVGVALVGGLFGFMMTSKKPPQDKTCLSYGGGFFEGVDFQKTVEPGHGRTLNGFFDKWYCYPTQTQRSYIITSKPGEGDTNYADEITAPSKDNIPLTVELAVYFWLNEDKLKEFHDTIGIKTSAFENGGWFDMLQEFVRPQIDNAWNRESRQYEAVEAYGNPEIFREIQANFATELPTAINDALGGDFFTDFKVVLRHVGIPGPLVTELENNKASAIMVKTKQNQILQAKAEAKAIEERQKALEGCQMCVLNEAIRSGEIDFWVIPAGQALTLPTPQRG